MALSIKSEEADHLARELSRLTGQNMTQAVTNSLRDSVERMKRARPKKRTKAEIQEEVGRMNAFLEESRKDFDFSKPITKADYDELCGDNDILAAIKAGKRKRK
jgi:antitoxin VapB